MTITIACHRNDIKDIKTFADKTTTAGEVQPLPAAAKLIAEVLHRMMTKEA